MYSLSEARPLGFAAPPKGEQGVMQILSVFQITKASKRLRRQAPPVACPFPKSIKNEYKSDLPKKLTTDAKRRPEGTPNCLESPRRSQHDPQDPSGSWSGKRLENASPVEVSKPKEPTRRPETQSDRVCSVAILPYSHKSQSVIGNAYTSCLFAVLDHPSLNDFAATVGDVS